MIKRKPPEVIEGPGATDDDISFEKISEVVLYLREVNGDKGRTAKKFKVPITKVTRWKERYGKVLYSAHPIAIPSIEDGIKAKRELETEGLRESASELVEVTLKKIKERVEDEDIPLPTKDFIAIVKEVFPYILPKFSGAKGNVDPTNVENTYNVVMNNIFNKLNGNDNSKDAVTGNQT